MRGNASIRYNKHINCLALTSITSNSLPNAQSPTTLTNGTSTITVHQMHKFDFASPIVLTSQGQDQNQEIQGKDSFGFQSSFYTRAEFIERDFVASGTKESGNVLIWDISRNKNRPVAVLGSHGSQGLQI